MGYFRNGSNGFDPKGILGGIFSGFKRGGSGINQQLLKNLLFGNERSISRKVQEYWEGGYNEEILTKDEIITTYFNMMDFGSVEGRPVVGIEQAARAYFHKSTGAINVYEAAVLVGMLNGPTKYNPLRYPDEAHRRALHVLGRMEAQGNISPAQKAEAIRLGPRKGTLKPIDFDFRYYAYWVIRNLNENLQAYGDHKELRIVIAMNSRYQLEAQKTIFQVVKNHGARGVEQGALVSMASNGLVHAIVGGADFSASQYDRATQARRQPGSTIKPIVFLAALQAGLKPTDRVLDGPLENGWPRNYGLKYEGNVELTYALSQSLNGATVRLAQKIGYIPFVNLARRLGINYPNDHELSTALGSRETTLLQMVSAYATVANEGKRSTPTGILAITSIDGLKIHLYMPGTPDAVVDASVASNLTQMLRVAVVSGTGQKANFGPRAVGKTGTTQENRDALFIRPVAKVHTSDSRTAGLNA